MPQPLYPRERVPGTHWIGIWVGPRAILDAAVKRKISSGVILNYKLWEAGRKFLKNKLKHTRIQHRVSGIKYEVTPTNSGLCLRDQTVLSAPDASAAPSVPLRILWKHFIKVTSGTSNVKIAQLVQ
jgi:hypothetical protein